MHAPLRPVVSSRVARRLPRSHPSPTEWRALAARALEPNVFYEPAFALAAAPVFGADAGAVLVWTGGGRLVGPVSRADRALARRLHSMLTGWTHPSRRSARRWSIATSRRP